MKVLLLILLLMTSCTKPKDEKPDMKVKQDTVKIDENNKCGCE